MKKDRAPFFSQVGEIVILAPIEGLFLIITPDITNIQTFVASVIISIICSVIRCAIQEYLEIRREKNAKRKARNGNVLHNLQQDNLSRLRR